MGRKSLKSLWREIAPFRKIDYFQWFKQSFVSLFRTFCRAPVSLPLLFKSDLLIIPGRSEKGKLLLTGEDPLA
jgi:hypothetical protein